MATVTGAISALAAFGATVTGIQTGHSYDLNAIPEKINRSELPCLICIPETATDQGYKTYTFMGNSPEFEFDVIHLLLYATSDAVEARKALPGLTTLLDNYLLALKALPYLGDKAAPPIHKATVVKPQIGITEYAGINYHSIAFKHHLCIYL